METLHLTQVQVVARSRKTVARIHVSLAHRASYPHRVHSTHDNNAGLMSLFQRVFFSSY